MKCIQRLITEIMIYDKQVMLLKNSLNLIFLDIILETSLRGSDFIFDCVNLLHYK